MRYIILTLYMLCMLGACAQIQPEPLEISSGHISSEAVPYVDNIPALIEQTSLLPQPKPAVELEKYTVVVNEVPVKEILFALARDAVINVDIDPVINGVVTINAVDQTLPQILNRIARQVALRYEYDDDNLIIMPDTAFVRTYSVNYLNLSRETSGSVTVSTQIASASSGESGGGGGGGGNTSTTSITSESNFNFWDNLRQSIVSIISSAGDQSADAVVVNPESGIITVRATTIEHEQIQNLIDQIIESIQRQVLIQATVVEVDLSDQYQAGIDWSAINVSGIGLNITSTLLGGAPGSLVGPPITSSSFVLESINQSAGNSQISIAISLLSEFGDTRVLTSPQIMALNNHTAVLKVVENFVHFEVEQDIEPGTD